MQTFLPGDTRGMEFVHAAAMLDDSRLGKQRAETMQIWLALTTGKGWIHHPATKMWKGHEKALLGYGIEIAAEWRKRGKKDTTLEWFEERYLRGSAALEMPPWLGDPLLAATHRSSLLRKDPAYYGRFGWNEPEDLEYVWPVLDKTFPLGYFLQISRAGLKRVKEGQIQDPFMWADAHRPQWLLEGVR